MGWAEEELGAAKLGDARRSRRLVRLVERLAEQPSVSIAAACSGTAETKAAYRLLSHEAVGWSDILAPHLASSLRRMGGEPVVLCLQDTTELDFNGQAIGGLGPLSYEAQRGMYLHATYAVSAQRVPLGVLDAWMWAREATKHDAPRGWCAWATARATCWRCWSGRASWAMRPTTCCAASTTACCPRAPSSGRR